MKNKVHFYKQFYKLFIQTIEGNKTFIYCYHINLFSFFGDDGYWEDTHKIFFLVVEPTRSAPPPSL